MTKLLPMIELIPICFSTEDSIKLMEAMHEKWVYEQKQVKKAYDELERCREDLRRRMLK